MTEYMVVSGASAHDLALKINRLLKTVTGWKYLGGVAVAGSIGYAQTYTQALEVTTQPYAGTNQEGK